VVRTPDYPVTLPAGAATAVERLRRGDVLRVDELLADGPDQAGVELARTLLGACLTVLA
jgi:hypothetical protein